MPQMSTTVCVKDPFVHNPAPPTYTQYVSMYTLLPGILLITDQQSQEKDVDERRMVTEEECGWQDRDGRPFWPKEIPRTNFQLEQLE